MEGIVKYKRQCLVPLTVRGASGQEQTIETLLDTGFNGSLFLPPSVAAGLGFPVLEEQAVRLADDRRILTPVYLVPVLWDGTECSVRVVASGDKPLLGMALCAGHNVNIDMVDGGRVQIAVLA